MSKIDLHVHSMYSDGTNSPKELVDMAVSIGLRAMALTDHDTIDGVPHAIEAARDYDITIIPGVEISTFYQEGEIHIIGLFVDYNNKEFVAELDQMRIEREDRNRLMCSRLRKYGVDIDYDKLVDIYKSHAITRAHFADFLYKNGYVSGRKEAFERYIGSDCPAFVQRKGISPKKGIKLIQQAHGVPILAHPYAYRLSEKHLDELISNLKDHGLAGIEAFYSTHGMSETDKVRNYAKKYDLMLSGGSDYHGKNKPLISLGSGMGGLKVNSSLLVPMQEYLKKEYDKEISII